MKLKTFNQAVKKGFIFIALVASLVITSITINAQTHTPNLRNIQNLLEEHNVNALRSVSLSFLNEAGEARSDFIPDGRLKFSLQWQVPHELREDLVKGDYIEVPLPKTINDVVLIEGKAATIENDGIQINLDDALEGAVIFTAKLSNDENNPVVNVEFMNTLESLETFTITIPTNETPTEDILKEEPIVSSIAKEGIRTPQSIEVVEQPQPIVSVDDSKANIAVSRFDIYTLPSDAKFLSGEEVLFYTGISLTEDSGTLTDAILEVKIPKEHLVDGTFVASDIASQVSKEVIDAGDHYKVIYKLAALASGTSLDIPMKFVTHNGETPNGFPVAIEATLKQQKDELVLAQTIKDIIINTVQPRLDKMIYAGSWTSSDNRVVNGGTSHPDDETRLTDDLSQLNNVQFTYTLNATNTTSAPGSRIYDTFIFEDVLPKGAIFVAEDNPGWTYDAATRTARKTYTNSDGIRLYYQNFSSSATLNLKFPNAPVNETLTNTATVTAAPKDRPEYEAQFKGTDTIDFKLDASKPVPEPTSFSFGKTISPWSFLDYQKDRDRTHEWRLSIGNSATSAHPNLNLNAFEIVDSGLDARLKYTYVTINAQTTVVGTLDIIATLQDGTQEIIATNVDPKVKHTYPLKAETVAVTVKSVDHTYLAPGKTLNVLIGSELRDKTVPVVGESSTTSRLSNDAGFKATYSNGLSLTGKRSDYIQYSRVNPTVSLRKDVVNRKLNYFINDHVAFQLNVDISNLVGDMAFVDSNALVDIIPDGTSYVPGSASLVKSSVIESLMTTGSFEPEVISNFKGTGHTALVWKLEGMTYTGTNTNGAQTGVLSIQYETKITELTNPGTNINTAILSWKNNNVVKPGSRPVSDEYDLNENSATDDLITSALTQFNYVPPRELMIRKAVKGSLDSNYILPPSTGLSEIGTEMSYQLSLYNNSVTDISNLNILDLLPKVGDETVSTDMSLESPSRIARNSTFKLNLSGPIQVPHDLLVFYTTDEVTPDVKTFYTSANWTPSPTNYDAVTAFKIVLKPGAVLRSGQEIQFDVSFKVPRDIQLDVLDKAVNTFGVATTSNLDFFESNHSTVDIVKYNVSGHVFDDFNEDGLFDKATDTTFEAYSVRLVDKAGNDVYDLSGNPYEVRTDTNGFYSMDVYRQGEYRIKVITPVGYTLTRQMPDENGSHIEPNGRATTSDFALDRLNPSAIRNAGYFKETVDVTIHKVLHDAEGVRLNKDRSFTFNVSFDETDDNTDNYKRYQGMIQVYEEDMTYIESLMVQEGIIRIPANRKIVVKGLPKNARIKASEIVSDLYNVEGGSIDAVLSSSSLTFTVINTVKVNKMDYTMDKVWVNGPDIKPEIVVQLFQNDQAYGNPVVLENGETTYRWTDLDTNDKDGNPFEYRVDEIAVPVHYEKHVDGTTITNTYIPAMTDFTVRKVWIDGPELKPTISMQLYQNGLPYLDAVDLESGQESYTWKQLPVTDLMGNPFTYTVDEINVPSGYSKHVDGTTITNTFTPGKLAMQIQKVWVGGPTAHPTITVQLYRNGVAYQEPRSLFNGETSVLWRDLDAVDSAGNAYIYTVDEINVPEGYVKSLNGNVITNTYVEDEPPIVKGVDKDPKSKDSSLPNTGMGNSMLLFGFASIIVGLFTMIRSVYRKRHN
ncbi:Cna B-type domain-containing protein [Erysipelothrix aquatica]|uniref:Cna B-type domain-containing protein n=1 Tax=Erysipelothrix aquatica TaxID=2683714 RepID=UPI00135B1F19|nr:Cna B-type domain-containing protein [Erysipelothrix aquatica]